MCKCKAYFELSGQSYISRANFAHFIFQLTATALFPSTFSVSRPGVLSASMQRPLISRTQTRDGAFGEGQSDRRSTQLRLSINYSKMLVEPFSHLSHLPPFHPYPLSSLHIITCLYKFYSSCIDWFSLQSALELQSGFCWSWWIASNFGNAESNPPTSIVKSQTLFFLCQSPYVWTIMDKTHIHCTACFMDPPAESHIFCTWYMSKGWNWQLLLELET